MPSIQVTGQLVDPTTGVEVNADIRIASVINYGQTTKKSISHKSTDASGNYNFPLVYGKHLIFVKYEDERIYIPIGYAVVGDSTPDPIDLIQLINLSDENPPSELVTELQQLREDTLNDIVETSAQVLENAGYQGEWVIGTSTALKGETWQVSGRYYVALKDTSVDPINDNENWREVVNTESVTTAQNDIVGGSIFKGSNGEFVEVGDQIPIGTTHLRISVGGSNFLVKAWDNLTLPAIVTTVPTTDNGYYGYEVVTDQGTFEFVKLDSYKLRKSYDVRGWGYKDGDDIALAMQRMADTGEKYIKLSTFDTPFSSFEWKSNVVAVVGLGRTILRGTGSAVKRIRADDNNRVRDWYAEGFELIGSGVSGEFDGWALEGFSYGCAVNVKIRGMRRHNWTMLGDITPVNRQASNNDFYHCTGNNSVTGSGMLLLASDDTQEANTANNWFGGEFAGNSLDGFNIDNVRAGVNILHGVTLQGNGRYDYRDNGNNNKLTGYLEGNPKSVLLDVDSRNSEVSVRSTYPLWNTVVDLGTNNKKSLMGQDSGFILFDNSTLTDWVGNYPRDITPSSLLTLTAEKDSNAEFGFHAKAEWSSASQYIDIKLSTRKPESFTGKTVTLAVTYKNVNNITASNLRVYAAFGSDLNTNNGKFAVQPWVNSFDYYSTLRFDVTFPETYTSGDAIIRFFLNDQNSPASSNYILIDELVVIDGVSFDAYPYDLKETTTLAASGTSYISDINSNVNQGIKRVGIYYLDTSTGIMYFPVGDSPSSIWRQIGNSGTITPS